MFLNPEQAAAAFSRRLAIQKANDEARAAQEWAEENERRLVRERECQASDPVKRRQQIIDEVWDACQAAVPAEVKAEIDAARAERDRTQAIWQKARTELDDLANRPPEDIGQVEEWELRRLVLERSLPRYDQFRKSAQAAYEVAQAKSRPFLLAEYQKHYKEAAQRLLEAEERTRKEIDQLRADAGAVGTVQSRCQAGLA